MSTQGPANAADAEAESASSSITLKAQAAPRSDPPSPSLATRILNLKHSFTVFERDHRARIPPQVARFIGYRPADSGPLLDPLPFPPFSWLKKIPPRYEHWLLATIGAFTSILLIEAIMTTGTAFRDAYHSPIIVASFGASAVLMFGVPDAPLAQPRNAVLGQFISALVGVCITKLWRITNPDYASHLNNRDFYAPGFVNGALCMAIALLAQLGLGVVHPPGGATALAAATDAGIVDISWDYLPVVLASSLIMLGWAMIINNVGRKRYPVYWWTPGKTFVKEAGRALRELEEGDSNDLEHGVDFEALGETISLSRTRSVSYRHN